MLGINFQLRLIITTCVESYQHVEQLVNVFQKIKNKKIHKKIIENLKKNYKKLCEVEFVKLSKIIKHDRGLIRRKRYKKPDLSVSIKFKIIAIKKKKNSDFDIFYFG